MASDQPSISTLVALRAAYHPEATPKYDRVVFEFNGPVQELCSPQPRAHRPRVFLYSGAIVRCVAPNCSRLG